MTRERFYKLAQSCGLDLNNPALENMWNNRPKEIDNPVYDEIAEEVLIECFKQTAEVVRQTLSSFNN